MKYRNVLLTGLVVAALWVTPSALAQVQEASTDSFHIERDITIEAPRERVWAAMMQIEAWWHPDHTYLGDAERLSIDAMPGGCFCESLPGGGTEHMRVLHVAPGELLRLGGGLGPLQEFAVAGTMTWTLSEAEVGTQLTLTYRVSGLVDGGLDSWAEPVDGVLHQAIQRLARFVETGTPDAPDS